MNDLNGSDILNNENPGTEAGAHASDLARVRALARAILAAGPGLREATLPIQDQRLLAGRLSRMDMTVRVLYAGCGPFAFLLLPLLALWPADLARFTMLERVQFSYRLGADPCIDYAVLPA